MSQLSALDTDVARILRQSHLSAALRVWFPTPAHPGWSPQIAHDLAATACDELVEPRPEATRPAAFTEQRIAPEVRTCIAPC